MGKAYVRHPDLGNQVGEISDHPDVVALWKIKGFDLVDPPEELDGITNGPGKPPKDAADLEKVNGPSKLSQTEADLEKANGPGIVQDQPTVEETNGTVPSVEHIDPEPPRSRSRRPVANNQNEGDES